MSGYKDYLAAKAMELAWELHDKDFYELTDAEQMTLYDLAMNAYVNAHVGAAENLEG